MIRSVFVLVLACAPLLADATPSSGNYVIQTVAGSDFVGDGGPALSALLSQAEGIAIDRAGTMYIADADDNRVRKITPNGTIQTVAGTGVAGYSGDGGPATTALLSHPYGVATDAAGNLFIADLGNARVRKVSLDGTIQTVAGGGSVVAGDNGDGSPAIMTQLLQPRNLAIDLDGTLYVSDFGANRVFRISATGIIITLAGNGHAGFGGDGRASQLAQLNAPAGIASDGNGGLYIADSGNNRIRRVLNGVISTVFNVAAPTGVAIDKFGMLYVAARGYFGSTGKPILGVPFASDVALDAAGDIYASTGQLVRKIKGDGTMATIAGSGAARYFGGDDGRAATARLNFPSGVAIDAMGNIYIADTRNNRIRKVSTAGVISTIAGTGVPGSTGDNGPAALAQLNAPRSVAVDSLNNIYIADTGNNQIRKITSSGIMVPVATGLNDPEAVAVDSNGSVYIADTKNNRLLKLSASGVITTLAQLLQPVAATVDSEGNVFVAEFSRISKISQQGVMSVALDGLNSPRGLAVTAQGDLLIADTAANVVRRLDSAGALTTIAGTGAAGFSSDNGPASEGALNSPGGLALDSSGSVLIADQANHRIRSLTPVAGAGALGAAVTIVNAATLTPGPVAPGEIVTILGSGFDPLQTQVLFDGKPAVVFYAGSNQLNALAPVELSPNSATQLGILVKGAKVVDASIPVIAAVPGIFTIRNGTGPAAANNENGALNSLANPAAAGSVIVLYATGGGLDLSSAGASIGGVPAEVIYAGPAPGFVGLIQLNVRIPSGTLASGLQPIMLTIGKASSQPDVTIAVR